MFISQLSIRHSIKKSTHFYYYYYYLFISASGCLTQCVVMSCLLLGFWELRYLRVDPLNSRQFPGPSSLHPLHLCVLPDEHLCFNLNCVGLFKKWLKASYPTPASSEGAARLHLLLHKWVFAGATFRASCWHHLLLTVFFFVNKCNRWWPRRYLYYNYLLSNLFNYFFSAVVAKFIVTHHSEWPQDGAVGFWFFWHKRLKQIYVCFLTKD